MTLKRKHSVSSDSSEGDSIKQEPLTQLDPQDPLDCAEDGQSTAEKSPKKNSRAKKSVTVNSTFTIEELTPDDEIFTLQCPEKFNKQDLCDKNIDFTQLNQTITSNSAVYQLELMNTKKNSISLAIPKKECGSCLVNFPVKGHIVIKKLVDSPAGESEVAEANRHDKHAIAFPTDIKVRHPLLGTDWKAHIDSVNEVISKKKLTKTKVIKEESLEEKKDTKLLKRGNSESEVVVNKKKKKKNT